MINLRKSVLSANLAIVVQEDYFEEVYSSIDALEKSALVIDEDLEKFREPFLKAVAKFKTGDVKAVFIRKVGANNLKDFSYCSLFKQSKKPKQDSSSVYIEYLKKSIVDASRVIEEFEEVTRNISSSTIPDNVKYLKLRDAINSIFYETFQFINEERALNQ